MANRFYSKLNHKTASLITNDRKRWRVSYGMLFKVLEGEAAMKADTMSIGCSGNLIEHATL